MFWLLPMCVLAEPKAYIATWAGWGPQGVAQLDAVAQVVELDVATMAAGRRFAVANGPTGVAVSEDGKRVFVTSRDGSALTQLPTSGGGTGQQCLVWKPMGVALMESPAAAWLLVAATDGVWRFRVGGQFSCWRELVVPAGRFAGMFDSATPAMQEPAMIVVAKGQRAAFVTDYASNRVAELEITGSGPAFKRFVDVGGYGNGSAVSANGRFLYVPQHARNRLRIVDLECEMPKEPHCFRELVTGVYPINVALSHDEKFLYVLNNGARLGSSNRMETGKGTVTVIKTGPELKDHSEQTGLTFGSLHIGPEGLARHPCEDRFVVTYRDDPEGWVTLLKQSAGGALEVVKEVKVGPAGAQGQFIASDPSCSRRRAATGLNETPAPPPVAHRATPTHPAAARRSGE